MKSVDLGGGRTMIGKGGHQRVIGDYIVTQQIGSGSFAVVWRASHRFHGNEVAIKEIATERLNKKLQESLLSEIAILKKTNHPNIIRLHEIVEVSNRIYLVLEYCAGGDLAAYIQRYGKVSETTARNFMRQLGAGLQVLRANNLIHRDLKPQNLLLSTNDCHAILKIADFGFARSLQPQGLAETLCGSPLYMAPEILQFQKYDAKADLWSVGAILFQLVTGVPPFSGNSHVQLLQNIVTSNELRFPEALLSELHPDYIDLCRKLLRRNPVERLSFEEFFNHNFLGEQIRSRSGFSVDSSSSASSHVIADSLEHSQDDCLPFVLDEEPQGPSASCSSVKHNFNSRGQIETAAIGKVVTSSSEAKHPSTKSLAENSTNVSKHPLSSKDMSEKSFEDDYARSQASEVTDSRFPHTSFSKRGTLFDSLEYIEREYVLVNAPLTSTETLSSSFNDQAPIKEAHSPNKNLQKGASAPVPILSSIGVPGAVSSLGSQCSLPSGTSLGSLDSTEGVERVAVHPPTRLQSLENSARVLSELANEKLDAGQRLEAFSIQLVCLAIWKEALCVCNKSAEATSGCNEIHSIEATGKKPGYRHVSLLREGLYGSAQQSAATSACAHIESEFFSAVEHADQLASNLGLLDGHIEMPDAMEIIFQSALSIGRNAAVDELMDNATNAALAYSKAAILMHFLLVEAPSLPLNPSLVLSSSDKQRLHRYVDLLTSRQNLSVLHGKTRLQDQQNPS